MELKKCAEQPTKEIPKSKYYISATILHEEGDKATVTFYLDAVSNEEAYVRAKDEAKRVFGEAHVTNRKNHMKLKVIQLYVETREKKGPGRPRKVAVTADA